MSKFVSRAAFVGAAIYSGALAQTHRGQLWDALKTRLGLTDVNRTTVTATETLTLSQCGPLQVDASAGNVVLTLPASGVAADEAVYEIDRIDSTAHTVTLAADGTDTIDGAASVLVLGTMTLRLPAGSTVWRVHSISGSTSDKARVALGFPAATGGYVLVGNGMDFVSVPADHEPLCVNGTFEVNKRSQTSVADDTYGIDGFYVLTEIGNVTVAQTTDPESGSPWGFRLTQPDASAKRMGLATIIESKDCRKLRGAVATLASRVKFSSSGVLRYAILEHTGTADSVISDVVNNWASTNFTAGNFFIAGLNILQCGTVTPGAATWADLSGYGTVGASMNNLICLVWTEAAAAQNVTLEFNRFRCIPGAVVLPQRFRPNELSLSIRYFYKCPMAILARGCGNVGETNYSFPTPMRASPTLAGTVDSADATSGSILATADGVVFKATFGATSSARYGYVADWTADAAL